LWVRPQPTLEWSARKVLHLGKLLALPTNIGLGWKGLPRANTLAYIEDLKSLITLNPEGWGQTAPRHLT